jgi:hypothetical protein
METSLMVISLVTLLFAIISLSVIFTNFILNDSDNENNKHYRYLWSLFFFFALLTYASGAKWDNVSDERIAAEKKEAIYYEVTAETIRKISLYCEDEYTKYSTQNNCKRNTQSSLKHGESYNGFKPSTTVVKPSGVAPK